MLKTTDNGIYLLEIYVFNKFSIKISNNLYNLMIGYYYYVGSAQKNLQSRIDRHKKKIKKIHWHIDNITTNINSDINNVFVFINAKKDFECELRDLIEHKFNLTHPIKNFGNSDCNKCFSHLLYSKNKIDLRELTMLNVQIIL